jgi:F-type H+-transporting ATPase subunit epsilon
MHTELQVEIISPEGYLFNGHCHLVTIPSVEGEMGLMADHEAVLISLKEGKVAIFDNHQNILKEFSVKSGFAEMFNNRLLVLVDD